MKIAVSLLVRSRLCPGCTCGEGVGISRAQPPESPGLTVVPYLTSLSLPPASSAEAGRSGRKTRKKRGGEGNRRQKTAPSWTRAWNSGKHPFPFIRAPHLSCLPTCVGKPGASLWRLLGGSLRPAWQTGRWIPKCTPSLPVPRPSPSTPPHHPKSCAANPRDSVLVKAAGQRTQDSLLWLKRLPWLQASEIWLFMLSVFFNKQFPCSYFDPGTSRH